MKINTKILVFYSKTFVYLHHQTITKTLSTMKTQRQPITNERLLEIRSEEIAKTGEYVWSDRRKTCEEMLKMRGVKY